MKQKRGVLVSWVAVNNDPYERERGGSSYRVVNSLKVMGPTLTLLCDPDSPYRQSIGDVVLLQRTGETQGDRETRAARETVAEIRKLCEGVSVRTRGWKGDDPTDHAAIFEFLQKTVPALRDDYPGRNLVIHVSPGTPSMHTLWVLMGETGMIEQPFELVKSYRASERRGRPPVVPVHLGIDTFFKAYQAAQPRLVAEETEQVFWDPKLFKSELLKSTFSEASRFARVRVPVLILGERGTGKTTLASWMRVNSPFRKAGNDSSWPAVPCGQYNPETMRAELFGYRKGAFTGATDSREGLLAAADGDTLFLDEIGDVSRDVQRLLIKAVEENTYSPLGSTKSIKSTFRLITATNRALPELRKILDPDFLDRISLLKIEMPSLRDIRDDTPWLWRQVLAHAIQRSGVKPDDKRVKEVSPSVVQALQSHPLPGNLRDLFRVAYRLIAGAADVDVTLPSSALSAYALAGLSQDAESLDTDLPDAVLRRYLQRKPLDSLLIPGRRLETGAVFKHLKAYLAGEIRRCARLSGVDGSDLCDVADRTLRDWSK